MESAAPRSAKTVLSLKQREPLQVQVLHGLGLTLSLFVRFSVGFLV